MHKARPRFRIIHWSGNSLADLLEQGQMALPSDPNVGDAAAGDLVDVLRFTDQSELRVAEYFCALIVEVTGTFGRHCRFVPVSGVVTCSRPSEQPINRLKILSGKTQYRIEEEQLGERKDQITGQLVPVSRFRAFYERFGQEHLLHEASHISSVTSRVHEHKNRSETYWYAVDDSGAVLMPFETEAEAQAYVERDFHRRRTEARSAAR